MDFTTSLTYFQSFDCSNTHIRLIGLRRSHKKETQFQPLEKLEPFKKSKVQTIDIKTLEGFDRINLRTILHKLTKDDIKPMKTRHNTLEFYTKEVLKLERAKESG